MRDYQPNERIVDRAVELWKRMLRNPTYDNGDKSERGFFAPALASMIPNNADEENLAAFGMALKEALMKPNEHGYYITSLCTDYDPDLALNEAAKKAGLKMQFPWKTNMYLNEDRIYLSAGYAAEPVYHYPLSDGRWLVTRLSGLDISKIIEYVNGGTPTFEIERAG